MAPDRFHPMAFCPDHGLFELKQAGFAGIGTIQFSGRTPTNCEHPWCNRECEVVPGLYTPDIQGRVNLLLDQNISPAMLAAVLRLAEQVRDGQITPEQAVAEAAKIDPLAVKIFKGITPERAIAFATLVVAVLTFWKPPAQTTIVIRPEIEQSAKPPDWMAGSAIAPPPVPLPKPRPKTLK